MTWYVSWESTLNQNVAVTPNNETSKLSTFDFETVKVNNSGEIIKRLSYKTKYFTEDLGNGVTLDMVYIPGGTFMMGSPEGEGYDNEKPQHQVTIKPFSMAKYEITQAQWQAIASRNDLKVNKDLDSNPAYFTGDNRPVENVSWEDGVEFSARLSRLTNKKYSLPSEAQWEYAARAGTTTPFYFGETITTDLVNYNGNYPYSNAPRGEYREETTPVGTFPPNAFGLYDMHGNVWEWVEDDYVENYQNTPNDGTAYIVQNSNTKVLRGSSWYGGSSDCASGHRNYYYARVVSDLYGFRVVCV